MLILRSLPASIVAAILTSALLALGPAVPTALPQDPESAVAATRDQEELRERIEGLIARTLEQPGAVGLSVAVAIGDELVLAGGYGIAEAEHGVPVDVDTLFRIGSVTKQFTAAAVMRLVEQEELTLEDLLNDHLPDFPPRGTRSRSSTCSPTPPASRATRASANAG